MSSVRRSKKVQVFSAGVMTGTTVLTSTAVDCSEIDSVGIQMVWTGTPNGTFACQVSDDDGTTWSSFTLSPVLAAAAGGASNTYSSVANFGHQKIRFTYTNTSSTGVLNGTVYIKGF